MIVIYGVKHFPQDIEKALAASHIPGIELSYVASFPYRPSGAQTEGFCVAYHPTFDLEDAKARSETADLIVSVASTVTRTKPYRIIPLPQSQLWRSSLGKLSRTRIQKEFERGSYRDIEDENARIINSYRSLRRQSPRTQTEETVLKLLCDILDFSPDEFGVDGDIFSLGITSITLIELLERVHEVFASKRSLSVLDCLSNPVIRDVAQVIDNQGRQRVQSRGSAPKTGHQNASVANAPGRGQHVLLLASGTMLHRQAGIRHACQGSESWREALRQHRRHGRNILHTCQARAAAGPVCHCGILARHDRGLAVLVSYFLDLIPEKSVRTMIPSIQNSLHEDIVSHLLRIARPSQGEALNLDAAQLLRIITHLVTQPKIMVPVVRCARRMCFIVHCWRWCV